MNVGSYWTMTKAAIKEWTADKVTRLAAALSYYTMLSIAPLLVLIVAIVSFIAGGNFNVRQQIVQQIQSAVGPQAGQMVNTAISNLSQPRNGIFATVLGAIFVLLGATGVFVQLQDALNTIWNVELKPGQGFWNIVQSRFLSFLLVLGISLLILGSLVATTLLAGITKTVTSTLGGFGFLWQLVNFFVYGAILTLVFALIYKILPDVEISWDDVWVGSIITAVLFMIGNILIGLYLGHSAITSVYGAAGSLVALLIYVYYSALILFFGAEFTQVYARREGKQIVPADNAKWVTPYERAQQGMQPYPEKNRVTEGSKGTQPAGASAPKKPARPLTPLDAPEVYASTVMMPITGQAGVPTEPEVSHEKVSYNPPNPESVVPVIAMGAVASVYTVGRILRKLFT